MNVMDPTDTVAVAVDALGEVLLDLGVPARKIDALVDKILASRKAPPWSGVPVPLDQEPKPVMKRSGYKLVPDDYAHFGKCEAPTAAKLKKPKTSLLKDGSRRVYADLATFAVASSRGPF